MESPPTGAEPAPTQLIPGAALLHAAQSRRQAAANLAPNLTAKRAPNLTANPIAKTRRS